MRTTLDRNIFKLKSFMDYSEADEARIYINTIAVSLNSLNVKGT